MKRTISETQAMYLADIMEEWDCSQAAQAQCVSDLANLLECPEDAALDLLNRGDVSKQLGIEIYAEEPDDFNPLIAESRPDWATGVVIVLFIVFVLLSVYFIGRM